MRWLQDLKFGQSIRTDGPQSHLQKTGTPTMGGLLIVTSIVISTLCWSALESWMVWLCLFVFIGFALLGARDDYLKIKYKNAKGVSARAKLFWQILISLIAGLYCYYHAQPFVSTHLFLPFFKSAVIRLCAGAIVWIVFMVVGSSNAVNLTDGLDGLAIMPIVLAAAALAIYAYLTGNANFSAYLHIPHVVGAGELTIVCAAMFGAGLGFLWFNAYPAQMFMGDVGSLSLGALLGLIAVLIRQEIVFAIMAGIFVVETLSVILQVGSYKLRGKRLFKMAPIHHHFELKGWPEPIHKSGTLLDYYRYILVLIGLATLKLR